MWYNNVLELIGNTPLVKLNQVTKGCKGTYLVKVEYFNPGHSIKDRIAVKMIEDAEKEGKLKPGGTIVEGTSGNTGMGLALTAVCKGYKCVCTLPDKQSKEKMDILRAVGAEVVVCPTNVSPEDPRSYYSVAKRITKETQNSIYPNQYDNLSNTAAHYETTGPEIWEQTEGKITHFAAGVGTGGTISGITQFLKEKNPKIVSVGIDTYGSVFKKYKETGVFDQNEIYSYLTEGIGEDILPKNVNFDLIDLFIKVTDKDAAIMARRLSKEEGLFVGWSSGSAVAGALEYGKKFMKETDIMVIILPDHGSRYLGKIYNDTWMKDHGFVESKNMVTAKTLLDKQGDSSLAFLSPDDKIEKAIYLMKQLQISQIPVIEQENVIGSLTDDEILTRLIENPDIKHSPVKEVMRKPFPIVGINDSLETISTMINKDNKAILVRDGNGKIRIITEYDLLMAFSN